MWMKRGTTTGTKALAAALDKEDPRLSGWQASLGRGSLRCSGRAKKENMRTYHLLNSKFYLLEKGCLHASKCSHVSLEIA